jgi:hypothetical protein
VAHRLILGGTWIPFLLFASLVSLLASASCFVCLVPLVKKGHNEDGLLRRRPGLVTGLGICVVCSACTVMCVVVEDRLQAGHLELIHIPKNAGTSMESAGQANGIFWSATSLDFLGYQKMEDGNECSRYHVPPGLLIGQSPYLKATTFCAIRHPYSRAVSEYKYLLSADLQGHGGWGRKYAERYHNGLYDLEPCSAEGVNHFIQTTLNLYTQGQKFIDDCHHVRQVDYIWDSTGRQWCSELLKTEELPGSFDKLMAAYGYPIQMADELGYSSHQRCPTISEANLTAGTRRLLDEVYADDFRLLNYTPY